MPNMGMSGFTLGQTAHDDPAALQKVDDTIARSRGTGAAAVGPGGGGYVQ